MTWDERFSSRYDEWAAPMRADVPFYVQLALEAVGPVVELAVGNGRVAIPVAAAIQRRVMGIDISRGMIPKAGRERTTPASTSTSDWATCATSTSKSQPA
jgi:ubiquinone/menaquinone biosynthesis C-methylase UbiE